MSLEASKGDVDHFKGLSNLLFKAGIQTESDALFVALHTLMLEMDFLPREMTHDKRYQDFPSNYHVNGVCEIQYFYSAFPDILCQMAAVPLGKFLIVHGNLLYQSAKLNHVINIETKNYIHFENYDAQNPSEMYYALVELSRIFKDGFIIPLLCDIYELKGLEPAFVFGNMPRDLKFKILTYLPVESLVTIAKVDSEFRSLVENRLLWREIFKRDFPDVIPANTNEEHDWKELYKDEYLKRKALEQKNKFPMIVKRNRPIRYPEFPWLPRPIVGGVPPEIGEAFPMLANRFRNSFRYILHRNPYPYM